MYTNNTFSYPISPNDSAVKFYNKSFLKLFHTLIQTIIHFVSENIISGGKTTYPY